MSTVNLNMKSVIKRDSSDEKFGSLIQMRTQHKEYKESIEKVKLSHRIMRNSLKPTTATDKSPLKTVNSAKRSLEATKSSSGNSTGRSLESVCSTPPLNLTLYGSAAPICLQRPAPLRKNSRLPQPPNSPNDSQPKRPSLTLPVDKILLINERLSNKTVDKIELKLSHRQIKLNDEDDEDGNINTTVLDKTVSRSEISCSVVETPLSSTRGEDFTIDLSSVTYSEDETDSEDITSKHDTYFPCYSLPNKRDNMETSETETTWSRSPSHCIWQDNRSIESQEDSCCGASYASESISKIYASSTKRSSDSSHIYSRCSGSLNNEDTPECSCFSKEAFLTDRSLVQFYCDQSPWERPQTATELCRYSNSISAVHEQHRARSADLICVYVNTVNNGRGLSKYFRPCSSCNEPCCTCQDSDHEEAELSSQFKNKLTMSRNLETDCEDEHFQWKKEVIKSNHLESEVLRKVRRVYENTSEKIRPGTYRKSDDRDTEDLSHKKAADGQLTYRANKVSSDSSRDDVENMSMSEQQLEGTVRSNSQCSEFSDFLWERRYQSPTFEETSCYEINYQPSEIETQVSYDNKKTPTPINDCKIVPVVHEKITEPHSSSENKKEDCNDSVPMSIVQLATAAQCARILADSLEAVLESVNKELFLQMKKKSTTVTEFEEFDAETKSHIRLLEQYLSKFQENDFGDVISKSNLSHRVELEGTDNKLLSCRNLDNDVIPVKEVIQRIVLDDKPMSKTQESEENNYSNFMEYSNTGESLTETFAKFDSDFEDNFGSYNPNTSFS